MLSLGFNYSRNIAAAIAAAVIITAGEVRRV
jgi:hypothetical protein